MAAADGLSKVQQIADVDRLGANWSFLGAISPGNMLLPVPGGKYQTILFLCSTIILHKQFGAKLQETFPRQRQF